MDEQRHAITPEEGDKHLADNPGQDWRTEFDGRGFTVTPESASWTWGLELVQAVPTTRVTREGNRLSYVRGEDLTEWFVNDTRGLEQGWTLHRAPARGESESPAPVRLDLKVRGGLKPSIPEGGLSVSFHDSGGGVVLNYGGLKAWDADGKTLKVWFSESTATDASLALLVDDHGARYPVTIDPVAQQAYVKASNTDNYDFFGQSVAVSGDTVVVASSVEAGGSPGVNGDQTDNSKNWAGAVYVFVRNGTTWTQQAYLKASDPAADDRFGYGLAIEGDTLVAGAPGKDLNCGAAYVFTRAGTIWTQQAYLRPQVIGVNDAFGHSVAISNGIIVVGTPGEDSSATGVNGNASNNSAEDSGAAYVFVRSGTTWNQMAYIKPANTGANDKFGHSVAIAGNTIAIAAPEEASSGDPANNSAPHSGAVYVFTGGGTVWTQQGYLKAPSPQLAHGLGTSLAMSGDTIVASDLHQGAAQVFTRSGGTWSHQTSLTPSNLDPDDGFASSVAISGDVIAVGALGEDGGGTGVDGDMLSNSVTNSGAVYIFRRHLGTWNQRAYLKSSNSTENDQFGSAVALSGDVLVAGATNEKSAATGINGNQYDFGSLLWPGAAYIFNGLSTYWLTATAEHGTLTGAGEIEGNTVANLGVAPHPGYLFTGWTGDATGTSNPLPVLMDRNKTINATFSEDNNDTDGDGHTNYQESVVYGTNPLLADSDGDGVNDRADAFPLDPAETLDTDHDGTGDNADTDDDGDGLSDLDETTIHGTDPKLRDTDGDGLDDREEIEIHHTNPNDADSDDDGVPDGPEVLTHGSDPKQGDTDGDGYLDGYEVETGKSPVDPADKPALMAEAATAIRLRFPSALGKVYRIESSTNMTTWETIETGIPGNGAAIQRFYSIDSASRRFFRVEEESP